jgi:hypothetical protein
MGAIMKRREEVMQTIDFPYQIGDGEEKKPARGRGAKPAARGKPAARPARKY